MKLLHVESRRVVEAPDSQPPPYAILSHTWGGRLSGEWLGRRAVTERIIRAGQIAAQRGVTHLWVDRLCIDRSSAADLDEAVNGSRRRLGKCSVCLVHLDDLPADAASPLDDAAWRRCRYWRRAWTLQELVIPWSVEFYDEQWNHRGAKTSPGLLPLLSSITGIPERVLDDGNTLSDVPLAVRISWSAGRAASRHEDTAYSLAAMTGVAMPVRYGEGAERAFLRLQEEILHDTRDGSIFAWRSASDQEVRGLLARSPSEFAHFATGPEASACQGLCVFDGHVQFSSKGIRVQSRVLRQGPYALLDMGHLGQDVHDRLGVCLREWNGVYVRVHAASRASMSRAGRRDTLDVARDIDARTSARIRAQFRQQDGHVHGQTVYDAAVHDPGPCLPTPMALGRGPASPGLGPLATKRSRRVLTPESPRPEDDETSFSESEAEGSSSTGSGESDMDLDDDELDEPLSEQHAPRAVPSDLVQFSYGRFRTWTASARYAAPPVDGAPLYKRASTLGQQPYAEQTQDDSSRLTYHFHLACPFYVSDPAKYRQCLLEAGLRSIKGVMAHLRSHHAQPPYCPLCRQTFDRAADRDQHLRARTCELRSSPGRIDGVSKHQLSKLARRDKAYLGETGRWLSIWATVFPEAGRGCSPYLLHGAGRAASMLRDFWAGQGLDCILAYAETRAPPRERPRDNGGVPAALYMSTLQELLNKVLEEGQWESSRDCQPGSEMQTYAFGGRGGNERER